MLHLARQNKCSIIYLSPSIAPGATKTGITKGVPYDTNHQFHDRMGKPLKLLQLFSLFSFTK